MSTKLKLVLLAKWKPTTENRKGIKWKRNKIEIEPEIEIGKSKRYDCPNEQKRLSDMVQLVMNELVKWGVKFIFSNDSIAIELNVHLQIMCALRSQTWRWWKNKGKFYSFWILLFFFFFLYSIYVSHLVETAVACVCNQLKHIKIYNRSNVCKLFFFFSFRNVFYLHVIFYYFGVASSYYRR